jgi:hypothetical protein
MKTAPRILFSTISTVTTPTSNPLQAGPITDQSYVITGDWEAQM